MPKNKYEAEQLQKAAAKALETDKYTKEEKKWMADNFTTDNKLLFVIRKHFLQGKLTEAERQELDRAISNPVFINIIKKDFVPEISPDSNFNQLRDFYSYTDEKELSLLETGLFAMRKWEIVKKYFTRQFQKLTDENVPEDVKLKDLEFSSDKEDNEDALVEIAARNTIIRSIESQILVWKTSAVNFLEDRDEIKRILNSNK